MQQSPQPNQLLWQRFKRSFFTVKHVRKCLPELESPTYIAWSCTTGGGDGDKTKHKGVTGGCCLHYITFSYPVGIFLLGWYKQQVSGCARGSFPPGGAQCFNKHWPGEIYLRALLGLPATCFERSTSWALMGCRWWAALSGGQSAGEGCALAQGEHALPSVVKRGWKTPLFLSWGLWHSWVMRFSSKSKPDCLIVKLKVFSRIAKLYRSVQFRTVYLRGTRGEIQLGVGSKAIFHLLLIIICHRQMKETTPIPKKPCWLFMTGDNLSIVKQKIFIETLTGCTKYFRSLFKSDWNQLLLNQKNNHTS